MGAENHCTHYDARDIMSFYQPETLESGTKAESSPVARLRKIAGVSEQILKHGMRHFYGTTDCWRFTTDRRSPPSYDRLAATGPIYKRFLPAQLTAAQHSVQALVGSLRDRCRMAGTS